MLYYIHMPVSTLLYCVDCETNLFAVECQRKKMLGYNKNVLWSPLEIQWNLTKNVHTKNNVSLKLLQFSSSIK